MVFQFRLQHSRSKRPKRLAHLHERVDAIAHLRPPRIRENRSAAEGSRSKLHPALRPADHLSFDQPIHDAYPNAIVNTHPSLLPKFKGWHAVEDALAAGETVTGCTVHFATLEVDEGPILAQETVPVLPDDTVETLHERIKDVERRLYPEVLRSLLEDGTERGTEE